ncbi:fibrobacter succinogenes major paralogous domain-containing protein [Algoriphagus sp. CAU 1675]|uniref:fibrobacter succinogenes major paralogous domain-containing protein n=1 Tax=Algoriphagus sp. CAU 1675 TaxID=3032597 RepID=UPI0023DAC6F4|nr:fibrobacter succinogenes major paralogous domain-containing protein [Algoriphagus sp. CAU 1675]MDF2158334.1 fibrobacter succinogenes major paralogous domain-containing protein [Algoriphagus sp. CAU 1675]
MFSRFCNTSLVLLVLFFFGCSDPEDTDSIQELDQNAIQIGSQIWMKQNLDLKVFRNGDPIQESKSVEDWVRFYDEKIPAWTSYFWESENEEIYGIMYNYYAMIDPRGLAPEGWRIPTSTDFFELVEFNGGANVAGPKIMSSNYWSNGNNGSNESGFDARPGGEIWAGGIFTDINESFSFWTNSRSQSGDIISFGITTIDGTRIYFAENPLNIVLASRGGSYIRCIKE